MRADDLADFEEYVRGRGPALYRLAYLLVGHSHDAQDLVQDVLGTVSLRWANVRRSDNVDAYLRRAICNAAASRSAVSGATAGAARRGAGGRRSHRHRPRAP